VSCIEYVTGRTAFLLGKPNTYILENVLKDIVTLPERTLMIGDT